MSKKKKSAKNALIKSVMKDLKEITNPSIGKGTSSAFGSAFLNATGVHSSKPTHEMTSMALPEGLDPELLPSKLIKDLPKEESADTTKKQDTFSGQTYELRSDPDFEKTAVLEGQVQANKAPAPEEPTYAARTQVYSAPKVASSAKKEPAVPEAKVSVGAAKPQFRLTGTEPSLAQAETLKLAQEKIVELEKEIETLRRENELLHSANDISKQKCEDLFVKLQQLDRLNVELKERNEAELKIYRDASAQRDTESQRLKSKIEELESRLANDLRRVRIRERELENRLEIAKVERVALLRAKDEQILDLKRKMDQLLSDFEQQKVKSADLQAKLDSNNDQFARTVRALRLALSNLESTEESSITLAPIKKAE
ncbi:MAG: hypothetical protein LW875_05795 [Proteobacteria bacterium]|jgi:hypothetical protein|nr:hypothetical protein [Pseudomonadota bacterium]